MPNSKSLTQLSINAAIIAKTEEKRKLRQENCKHDFIIVPHFDYASDRVYYSARCRRCDYTEE